MAAWRRNRDPLFRGDSSGGVSLPCVPGNDSIVAHILYLGGAGRPTPYHSTTESRDVAGRFAGPSGAVYRTMATRAETLAVRHIGRLELLRLLRGRGQGRAKWPNALEVMQARRYVELWGEHLLDFAPVAPPDVPAVVEELYER